jgi:hypothetical protein
VRHSPPRVPHYGDHVLSSRSPYDQALSLAAVNSSGPSLSLSRLYLHTAPPSIHGTSYFTMANLRFAPWQSDVDVQFYAALAHIKINHDKLNDSARKVLGLYEVRSGEHQARSVRCQVHPNALTSDEYGLSCYMF